MDSGANDHSFEIKVTQNEIYLNYFLMVLALLIVMTSMMECFRPAAQAPEIWFQRSGSLMVIIAIFVEARLLKLWYDLNPIGMTELSLPVMRKLFLPQYKIQNRILLIMLFVGTAIWGYGDLLFLWVVR